MKALYYHTACALYINLQNKCCKESEKLQYCRGSQEEARNISRDKIRIKAKVTRGVRAEATERRLLLFDYFLLRDGSCKEEREKKRNVRIERERSSLGNGPTARET
jgi:hypothetical protein